MTDNLTTIETEILNRDQRRYRERVRSALALLIGVAVAALGPLTGIEANAAMGLIFSVGAGAIVGPIRTAAYRRIDEDFKAHESEWYAGPVGGWVSYLLLAVERGLFTVLLALEVSGAGAFILGVVALKMAAGWNLGRGEPAKAPPWNLRKAYGVTAVNLNLLSIVFAVIGAVIWNPDLLST